MWQVLWRLPIGQGIPIYGFGLMLFLAFILCTWLAARRAELEGIRKETVQDIAIWLFLGGLLGARLTYLLVEQPFQGLGPLLVQLPRIWDGGIVLYGSIAGGVVAYFIAWALIYRRRGLKTLPFLDAVAPAVALGIALGRMGCFLNGCCYGQVACAGCAAVMPVHFPMSAPCRPSLVYTGAQTAAGFTTGPGGLGGARVEAVDPDSPAYRVGLRPGSVITAVNGKSLVRDEQGDPADGLYLLNKALGPDWPRGQSALTLTFTTPKEEVTATVYPRSLGLYPTQLYETVSMTLLILLLLAYYPFRTYPGQVCAVLMVAYGLHRFLNEILRDDPRPHGLESYGSVFLVIAGVVMWLVLHAKGRKLASAPSSPGGASAVPAPAPGEILTS